MGNKAKTRMRARRGVCLPALLAALLLSSCGSSSAPQEPAAVEELLRTQLGIIARGIEREDSALASQPLARTFFLGANVALRYSPTAFNPPGPGGSGVQSFRQFLAGAFDVNANIRQDFIIRELSVNGDVATVNVTSDFNATRVDQVPPQNTLARIEDIMVFEREGGTWRLVRWDEEPANEELGE